MNFLHQLEQIYSGINSDQLINNALREEIPGGKELLDALEITKGGNQSHLLSIKESMIDSLKLRYNGKLDQPDRFIFTDSECSNRNFIVHTQSPRFIAEIFDSETQSDSIIDSLTISRVYPGDRRSIAILMWLDASSELNDDLKKDLLKALDDHDELIEKALEKAEEFGQK